MRTIGWAVVAGALAVLGGSAGQARAAPAAEKAAPVPDKAAPDKAAPAPDKAAPAEKAPAEAPRPVLVLGITRPMGVEAAATTAEAMDAYLSKKLGGEVRIKLFQDAASLGDAIANGGVDAAWLTPIGYVTASEQGPLTPLVRLQREGFTSYRSVLFVKADSPAKTLADLKGKKMAWVEPGSASGRMFPRAHLKKLGHEPDKFFASQIDVPDHKAVCQAVLEGKADVGASLSDERKKGAKPLVDGCRSAGLDPKQFRIVERTEPIPNDVIAVRAKFDPVLAGKLKKALLDLPKSRDGKKQMNDMFQADGFGAVTDADFAPVRSVQALLELK